MTVFANGMEISAKGQGCKLIAAMPDVCMTPPQTPATPPGVPIPYPNFGMDSDLASGSSTVKISGKPVSMENKSNYSKCSGDEAGCAPKKGVITSKNTGPVFAQAWSSDVKVEGKGVVRFGDIATSNHGCNPGQPAPVPLVGVPGAGVIDVPQTECPCCGTKPAHANQLDADGKMLTPTTEKDYYDDRMAKADAKIQDIEEDNRNGAIAKDAYDKSWGQYMKRREARQTITEARAAANPCPNLHSPADTGCGIHFKGGRSYSEILAQQEPAVKAKIEADAAAKHPGDPKSQKATIHANIKKQVREKILGFNDSKKKEIKRRDKAKGQVNHMTPLDAGGCPTSGNNLVTNDSLPVECQKLDAAQTTLQDIS